MDDLISREALLEIVGQMPLGWEYGRAVSDIYDIIKAAPTVDAVEVVLCKDCKWYNELSERCNFWHGVRHPEHYCGEGERKSNGICTKD